MNRKSKLSLFTLSEMYQLLKFAIGERLILSVSDSLRRTHQMINLFHSKGIAIAKDKKNLLLRVTINNSLFKIYLEKNSSDALVFKQVILGKEYHKIVNILETLKIESVNMIDAGANIGLTSIYFKAHFPKANIIALEPSSKTYQRLTRNIEANALSDVRTLKKGLWGHKTFLKPDRSFRDRKDWAFRLTETNERDQNSIEVISMNDIIKENKLERIDFLKIDIEGGEVSVFNKDADMKWLKIVKTLAIEIHDEFECREEIESLLRSEGFELTYSGGLEGLTIGVNRSAM